MQETLADVLGQFTQRTQYSYGQLAALSGVSKRTIANWMDGTTSKPQKWQGLVTVAAVLHLNESETNRLLQSAQHKTIAQLRESGLTEDNLALLAPWPPESPPPFQAMPDLSHFVGREQVLEEMGTALLQGSFVNICNVWGMGGVGKTAVATRLSYQLRSYFPDGVLWANLATSNPMAILNMFAQTYDQDVSKLTDLNERSTFVRNLLAHKRVLIILDDAQNSDQLRPLLPPTTGKPAVIITTRHDLAAADGFQRFEIKPFRPESGNSFTLFTHFLGQAKAEQAKASLNEIADLLGHLPLAIAIAAARLAYTPEQNITAFLAQIQQQEARLDQLIREDRGIRLSFDLSYQALTSELQHFFVTLGSFGGQDFSVEAVTAVTQLSPEVASQNLHELVRLSLVREEANQRYGLHPLLRDYAREKIEQNLIFERMVNYYVTFVRQNETDYPALDLEINNILAALQSAFEHNLETLLIDGVDTFYHFLEMRGLHNVVQHHLEQALQSAQTNDNAPGAALILSNLANLVYMQGDYTQAEAYVRSGLALIQQKDNPHIYGRLQYNLGAILTEQGELDQAETCLLENLSHARKQNDIKNIIDTLSLLGKVIAYGRKDFDQIEVYLQESYQLAQQINDQKRIGDLLMRLGSLAYYRNQWQQAETYYQEGIELSRKTGNLRGEANQLNNLGVMMQNGGEFHKAETYFQSSVTISEKINLNELMALTLTNLGEVTFEQGNLNDAQKHLQRAVSISRQIEHPANLGYALGNLGAVSIKQRDYKVAETYLQESLELAHQVSETWNLFTALRWWGELHLVRGQFDEAQIIWNQAKDVAQKSGVDGLLGVILYQLARLELVQDNLTEAFRLGQESAHILESLEHYLYNEVNSWLSHFPPHLTE